MRRTALLIPCLLAIALLDAGCGSSSSSSSSAKTAAAVTPTTTTTTTTTSNTAAKQAAAKQAAAKQAAAKQAAAKQAAAKKAAARAAGAKKSAAAKAAAAQAAAQKAAAVKAAAAKQAAAKKASLKTTTTPAASATPLDISSRTVSGLGAILVNSSGRTLYTFAPDMAKHVTCDSSSCTSVWPPLMLAAGDKPVGVGAVMSSLLGSDPDPHGGKVVTYNGWPLYTFSGDSSAGDTHGQALDINGGNWFVISTSGVPIHAK
jgi:predicted lipoprotein with Yx(FWY)xxD motif